MLCEYKDADRGRSYRSKMSTGMSVLLQIMLDQDIDVLRMYRVL